MHFSYSHISHILRNNSNFCDRYPFLNLSLVTISEVFCPSFADHQVVNDSMAQLSMCRVQLCQESQREMDPTSTTITLPRETVGHEERTSVWRWFERTCPVSLRCFRTLLESVSNRRSQSCPYSHLICMFSSQLTKPDSDLCFPQTSW